MRPRVVVEVELLWAATALFFLLLLLLLLVVVVVVVVVVAVVVVVLVVVAAVTDGDYDVRHWWWSRVGVDCDFNCDLVGLDDGDGVCCSVREGPRDVHGLGFRGETLASAGSEKFSELMEEDVRYDVRRRAELLELASRDAESKECR